jgi:hypothetical protein
VISDFQRDDKWQRHVRDSLLAPGFYGSYAVEGRYVFIDKGQLATLLQKRFAVDTILQGRDGAAVCVEEKIVRWKGYDYNAICLETESCTVAGYESPGWMHYGQADYLLYGMMKRAQLEVHLWDFPALKAWFWPQADAFPIFYMKDTVNHTRGRKAPLDRAIAEVPYWHRTVWPDPFADYFPELFPDAAGEDRQLNLWAQSFQTEDQP